MMKTVMKLVAASLLSDLVYGQMSVEMMKVSPAMYYNILEADVSNNLNIFVDLLNAADLVHELSNPDLVATVFAPTDAAFTNLLQAQDLTMEDLTSDSDMLASILKYHVVPDQKLFSVDLMDDMDLGTMSGGFLTVNVTGDSIMISGDDSDAMVVEADLTAGEGIVHLVDNVLLPLMF
eukprot:TRINITY_DN6670_c0_g2_i3.p3 TRINITY_DN6670_c0_g2~~TRINITY_DN6670_c0_g2_i3.p3  ORF type:complete len:178 (+),score=48.64 TRINITY_DN6670_c0_g2_i3:151-684(+)